MLLGTLSDLDKLNYDEDSKYQVCSSKIDRTHVYMLFQRQIDLKWSQHPLG